MKQLLKLASNPPLHNAPDKSAVTPTGQDGPPTLAYHLTPGGKRGDSVERVAHDGDTHITVGAALQSGMRKKHLK